MYIVRDKKTKAIIHVNPAPLSQKLTGKEVYFRYDRATMEIGKTDAYEIPAHFTIKQGAIVEATLQELVEQGIVQLAPDEKIVNNQIVHKTLTEKVTTGLIKLPLTYKIIGEGQNEQVVEKTLSEQVAEGLRKLALGQIIVGEGEAEQIVTKPVAYKADIEAPAEEPLAYHDR